MVLFSYTWIKVIRQTLHKNHIFKLNIYEDGSVCLAKSSWLNQNHIDLNYRYTK